MRTIGKTSLQVSRLCLGVNVFGWTADEQQSFAVLDAFAKEAGRKIRRHGRRVFVLGGPAAHR